MLLKSCLLIVIALLTVSCQQNEAQLETQTEPSEVLSVSIEEYNANPEEYVGKTLAVSGTVDHVCKHGGKRMFIMGDDPDLRIKIESTDEVGPFAMELEGSEVAIQGLGQVFKLDYAYLDEWEAEVRAEYEDHEEADTTSAEEGEDCHHHGDLENIIERINSMRQKIEESDKDYLPFYSLECQSYEEVIQ